MLVRIYRLIRNWTAAPAETNPVNILPVPTPEATSESMAKDELGNTMALLDTLNSSQSENLSDENDLFWGYRDPKRTHVSLNSNLDVTYKVSHTIRGALKKNSRKRKQGSETMKE